MPGPGMLYTESEANENVKQITDKLIQYGTHEIGHAFGLAHHLHRKGSQNVHLMDPDIVNISPEQRKFGASVLVRVWLRQKQKSRLNRGFNEQEFLRNRLQKLLKNRK